MAKVNVPYTRNRQQQDYQKLRMWAHEQTMKGAVYHNAREYDKATQLYQEVLDKLPQYPDALHLMGLLHFELHKNQEAYDYISQAIKAWNKEPVFYSNLSAVLVKLKRFTEAVEACDSALRLKPDLADAINNKALILPNLRRWQEAIALSREYVKRRPHNAKAWFNLGTSLQEWGQHEESLSVYDECLRLDPQHVAALVNQANAHKEMSNWSEAQRLLTLAEAMDPNFAEIYNIRGAIFKEIGRPNAAIQQFDRAQALSQEPTKLKQYEYNKGLCQLMAGVMPHGWVLYEHRWSVIDMPEALKAHTPWLGESLDGLTLVVSREQGQGDSLQFCRYIPMIKARWPTCRIIVSVDTGLGDLIRTLPGVDAVIETHDTDIELVWDKWVPMMSLAWIFGTTVDTIPNSVPYLHPHADLVEAWGHRVNPNGIRVGLVWSGGHRELEPKIWSTNRRRNCDWSMFEQMIHEVHAARPDIEFYSLQKGNPAEDELADRMKEINLPIVNLMSDVNTWMDTAALASHMDLVISVDTSMVHLAGAIGRPVWMLSRLDGCWRWMLRRTDSPWYPNLRIFRQTKPKDWQPVVDEITKNLIDFKP
jgi:tetratricopeptide (TPR) repeat protein